MQIIHYEVYVQEPRGWMLHARYPRVERELSLEEAKELERMGYKVRVVREAYYTDTNQFEESDIYATPGVKVQRSTVGATVREKRPATATAPLPRPKTAKPKPKAEGEATGYNSLAKVLAAAAVGLATALLAVRGTPEIILWFWRNGLQIDLQNDTYAKIQFAVFALTFLAVAVPLAIRLLPRPPGRTARADRQAAPLPAPAPLVKPRNPGNSDLSREPTLDLGDAPPDWEAWKEPAEPEPPEDQPLPAELAEPVLELPAEDDHVGHHHRTLLLRFLGSALDAVKGELAVLDTYNRFAINLYIAGATEVLADAKSIDDAERVRLVQDALETMGADADVARRFYQRLQEYILEPRYLRLIQAGRDAMELFLAGAELEAHLALPSAMRDWNRPADKKASVVTVMFTDMVGSTVLTQAMGDLAAQEIVRRHNSIVRTALSQTGGREIKHTGDGIMASFASAQAAVDAAIFIQRNVAEHNERFPSQEMHLRIGLNAGEPIEEEDDLFGTTVQIGARVCAATPTDQILCTSVVKELAQGKSSSFLSAGSHNLKGLSEAVELYQVIWSA